MGCFWLHINVGLCRRRYLTEPLVDNSQRYTSSGHLVGTWRHLADKTRHLTDCNTTGTYEPTSACIKRGVAIMNAYLGARRVGLRWEQVPTIKSRHCTVQEVTLNNTPCDKSFIKTCLDKCRLYNFEKLCPSQHLRDTLHVHVHTYTYMHM